MMFNTVKRVGVSSEQHQEAHLAHPLTIRIEQRRHHVILFLHSPPNCDASTGAVPTCMSRLMCRSMQQTFD
jgi:hypothetical protein